MDAFDGLGTPCLVVDEAALEWNLERMHAAVAGAGKRVRPHAKSHQCSALARCQIERGAVGVCAATVRELAGLVAAGIPSVLLTGPVVSPAHLHTLATSISSGLEIMLTIGDMAAVERYGRVAAGLGRPIPVLVDIDVGLGRTGVGAGDAYGLAIQVARSPHLDLRGVQAYAGHLQHMVDPVERYRESRAGLAAAAGAFAAMRTLSDRCRIFSASGTGSVDGDLTVEAVTEVQTGSYVFMDTEYGSIDPGGEGSILAALRPALFVLTTVVGERGAGIGVVDAGLKALYRDGGKPAIHGHPPGSIAYDWFGDEFGRIACAPGISAPRIGERLLIRPSHCDPTIALHDRLHLVRDGSMVRTWNIDLRGNAHGTSVRSCR